MISEPYMSHANPTKRLLLFNLSPTPLYPKTISLLPADAVPAFLVDDLPLLDASPLPSSPLGTLPPTSATAPSTSPPPSLRLNLTVIKLAPPIANAPAATQKIVSGNLSTVRMNTAPKSKGPTIELATLERTEREAKSRPASRGEAWAKARDCIAGPTPPPNEANPVAKRKR